MALIGLAAVTWTSWLALTAPAAGTQPIEPADTGLLCDRVLEDFSASRPGEFPQGWRTRYEHNEVEARTKKIYVVEKIGARSVLHASFGTHTITALRSLPAWSLDEYPVLTWRWRAVRLPAGGDESDSDKNDSAASVYLGWDVGFPFQVSFLRFAWSSTLPIGRVITRRLGHDRIVITESGPAGDDGWREARVDLLIEARRLLDNPTPPSPAALALTTDADATRSAAEAYYADFRLCRRGEAGSGTAAPEGQGPVQP